MLRGARDCCAFERTSNLSHAATVRCVRGNFYGARVNVTASFLRSRAGRKVAVFEALQIIDVIVGHGVPFRSKRKEYAY